MQYYWSIIEVWLQYNHYWRSILVVYLKYTSRLSFLVRDIVYDKKLNYSNDEAFSISTGCNCKSRYDKFVYFNRPRTHGIRAQHNTKEKSFTYFEEIQESKAFTWNLHQKEHTEVLPNASFYKQSSWKIYAHGIRCEN